MSELVVWLEGLPVADVTETRRGGLRLVYRDSAVTALGVGALCLSTALPVSPKPYADGAALSWCEGLLPEGETRTQLERQFGVRRGDTFGLLAALGRDCAGAVSFLPPGEMPAAAGHVHPLTADELTASVEALPQHPLGADEEVRVSLGGLQPKLLLVRTDDGWARPSAGAPSTHIIKPEPTDPALAGLAAAEALVQRAAALAGVPAAEVALEKWADRNVLVVTRYDRRVTSGGGVVRIHQEDVAQALGSDPPSGPGKYETLASTAPTYARLAGVLRDHAADVEMQRQRLGELMTVNVAVGNTDAHARNHSFLIRGGTVELAPLYDSAPTMFFAKTRQLALWVGGQAMLSHVTRRHLADEMRAWGVADAAAQAVVERVLTSLDPALIMAAEQLDVPDELLQRTLVQVHRLAGSPSARQDH
ncbi:MAG TPA: HipA domain-containing protein [Mycobacteriales bacterium]|nr:HipA domain-containing protein [Mycobacteriales bacterium]